MALTVEDGVAYRDGRELATVVWPRYDGADAARQGDYLLIRRDPDAKEIGGGRWAGIGGRVDGDDLQAALDGDGYDSDVLYGDIVAAGDAAAFDAGDAAEARLVAAATRRSAVREVREEAGIAVADLAQVGLVRQPATDGGAVDGAWEVHHYTATTAETPDRYRHWEGELGWHAADALDGLDFGLGHDAFVPYVVEGEPFAAVIEDAGEAETLEEATVYAATELPATYRWPAVDRESGDSR